MRVAVVGHVEWVEFALVERLPRAGEIVHAQETFEEAGGGGGVAAVQLARLAGAADLVTALGTGPLAERASAALAGRGVAVHAVERPRAQRRAFTFLDSEGERTITVMGDRLVPHGDDRLPWERLRATDGVYFTGGDAAALRHARAARVLVATPRARDAIRGAGVRLDALVHSGSDAGERVQPGELTPEPALIVTTLGARGGRWRSAEGQEGAWEPAPLPGPAADAYGAGDTFAAALTYALAEGRSLDGALDLAARCSATCLTGRGPYGAELPAPPRPV
ncbi:MAG TPA: PfkB family carbohydrate kinase [Solirubrobacteraceae bacterium]|nr:PfkB family carbohydrate kinase [Solirubrobacteraceae bacterium]